MDKYATYLDLGTTRIEEQELDLFPFLDPTLRYSLRAVGSTSRRPVLSPSRRISEPEANTPDLHPDEDLGMVSTDNNQQRILKKVYRIR